MKTLKDFEDDMWHPELRQAAIDEVNKIRQRMSNSLKYNGLGKKLAGDVMIDYYVLNENDKWLVEWIMKFFNITEEMLE